MDRCSIYYSLAEVFTNPWLFEDIVDGGNQRSWVRHIMTHGSEWIDISVPLREGMAQWPGDPPFQIERFLDQEKGDSATVSRMSLCVHTGTHMDAPLHFVRNGKSIDEVPLDAMIGPARIVEIDDAGIDDAASITREELQRHSINRGERILFRTRNSEGHIAPDGARYLVECGVRTIGIDKLSVGDCGEDGDETHRILLSAGIWVIEGLNLRDVEPGEYELVCLPLKLIDAEGAPARAALRKKNLL